MLTDAFLPAGAVGAAPLPGTDEPPLTDTHRNLADILADLLGIERVPVGSHFFDDLGADSLVMARFCARVRKHPDLPPVSMKDIYQHPTINSLAAAFSTTVPAAHAAPPPVQPSTPATVTSSVPSANEVAAPVGTLQYVVCGALQLLFFLGYCYLAGMVTAQGFGWISQGSGLIDIYLRSVVFGGGLFVAVCTLPIVAKWVLVGRWTSRQIRIWSVGYARFWVVKTLVRANPLVLFAGSPLYSMYLRALGAKVGRGAAVFTPHVPVCTDLLTIGAGTIIRKESFLLGYRAHAGVIQTGTVTIGRDVFIGDKTVLDINTALGDGSQLGHTSTLHSGQTVPAGERWHGSPAERTQVEYRRVPPTDYGRLRRVSYSVFALLNVFFIIMPLAEGGAFMLMTALPSLSTLLDPTIEAISSPQFYLDALVLSLGLFFGGILLGLLFVFTVPRVFNRAITPDKVYPLYGFHYRVHHAITRMTNIKFFTHLFGNSSYIVHYLRYLGYRLGSPIVQTGSNFGDEVAHENPYLSSVGSGTMVADGLSIMNADYSSTSFRVSRVAIGSRNFLGNNIAYPAQGRTGDNCLLATKVMVPLDGKIREGVGLLGSPSFEIPRSVERDGSFDHLKTNEELGRHLAGKNRYNLRTMGVLLAVRWLHFFMATLLGMAAADLYDVYSHAVVGAFFAVNVLLSAVYYVIVERCFTAFRPLKPQLCSNYDPYFWWHERLWKVPSDAYLQIFNGTPFKNVIWRLLGVRLGRRVFDDGCYLTERTLVTIGDHVMLNAGSKVQCHSQEDGTFKSDYTTIGNGCTLGVGAFVHYGVTMGHGAMLAADSFLMKGEEVPPHAQWAGNPAAEIPADPANSPQPGRVTERFPARELQSAGRHRLVVEPVQTQPIRPAGRHRHNVSPDRPPRDVAAGTRYGPDQPDQRAERPGHHGPSAGGLPRRRPRTAETAIRTQ